MYLVYYSNVYKCLKILFNNILSLWDAVKPYYGVSGYSWDDVMSWSQVLPGMVLVSVFEEFLISGKLFSWELTWN